MSSTDSGVFAAYVESLDRWVQVGIASGNLIQLRLLADDPGVTDDHPFIERIMAVIEGTQEDDLADLPIALTVPTGQRQLYEAVRELPYGQELSPEALLARIPTLDSNAEGLDELRETLRANPIPIVIPDHRVQGVKGALEPQVRVHLRSNEGLT